MFHFPDAQRFRELAREHQLIPVCRQLLSDGLTPVSAFHTLDDGGTACLFESVVGGENVGRFSFLAVKPFMQLSAQRQFVTTTTPEGVDEFECENPIDELRKRLKQVRTAQLPQLVTPDTMSFATQKTCPTRQPTTASCPICRLPSMIAWSSSTMSPRQ